jgi:hypothetical protein
MTGTRTRRRRFCAGAAGVALLAGGGLLSSCGTDPASLSLSAGSVSPCYRGLPAARIALHEDDAKLKGVHRLQVDKLRPAFPNVTLPPGDDDTEVCTFSFEGKFTPGQVTGAPSNSRGPYAIVVVSSKELSLVTSYVGSALPKDFSHQVAQKP